MVKEKKQPYKPFFVQLQCRGHIFHSCKKPSCILQSSYNTNFSLCTLIKIFSEVGFSEGRLVYFICQEVTSVRTIGKESSKQIK